MRSRAYFWFVLVVFLIVACDPAFSYRPTSLGMSDVRTWATSVNGVEIRVGEYEDILGVDYFAPQFQLINSTLSPAVIEGAHLVTASGQYEVQLPGHGELEWRRVAPSSEKTISLAWMFDQPATEVLGERPRIILDLRVGEEEHRLEVGYRRVE